MVLTLLFCRWAQIVFSWLLVVLVAFVSMGLFILGAFQSVARPPSDGAEPLLERKHHPSSNYEV
jgi:hypothetical protein